MLPATEFVPFGDLEVLTTTNSTHQGRNDCVSDLTKLSPIFVAVYLLCLPSLPFSSWVNSSLVLLAHV